MRAWRAGSGGSSEGCFVLIYREPEKPTVRALKAIDALRQVSALLDAKAPDDAAAFKAWLRQISQSTAGAANEGGGLFGIGGVQVSDAEKATLAEISTVLGS